jgi:hypothetical protein
MSEKPYPRRHSDRVDAPANPTGAQPDWRDGDSYRHLLELDNEGWAWEWLRRNPAYREYAQQTPLEQAPVNKPVKRIQIGRASADWGVLFR